MVGDICRTSCVGIRYSREIKTEAIGLGPGVAVLADTAETI